jgi:hypothetical protein
MHPQLELVDLVIRMLGWPALLAGLVWVIRKWDAGEQNFKTLESNTRHVVETVTQVKADVATIKSNHLAHLQDGITKLTDSNDKAVDLLQDIKSGINVLVDRTPRS